MLLVRANVRMAVDSIRSARWRSFLTMLGIIIGVASVVTIVSLGEGVKRKVVGQIDQRGSDLITVRPGKLLQGDSGVNVLAALTAGVMTERDLSAIQRAPEVSMAVPIATVPAVARLEDKELTNGYMFATTHDLPKVLNQEIEFGRFFDAQDTDRNFAVIGKRVAEELFGENVPIGRAFTIKDQTFIVNGVFEEFPVNGLSISPDYNAAIFIPTNAGKKFSDGQLQIQQVLVKPAEQSSVDETVSSLNNALNQAYGGTHNFSVLKQADTLAVTNGIVNMFTGMISGIAAISLIVGGIGIMNVMLVSVTERTREIGIRKAVGATDQQILTQFLVESAVISFVGGILGVIVALIGNYFIRILTPLEPIISFEVVGIAVGVALIVGMFFGVTPALRAAKKDPIAALRQI